MKFELKHLVAALALTAVGAAHADPFTVVAGGATFTGSGTLSFSNDLLAALDTAKISAVNYGQVTSTITKDTDGYYTQISASAPMQTLSLDDTTLAVNSVGTKGGLTLTAPVQRNISTGGTLTVTDIKADLISKTIFATVIGANGVNTITNFALWNFSTLVGPTQYNGPGTYIDDISGLTLTAGGKTTFAQALGLQSLGIGALNGITNYGSIHSVLNTTLVLEPVGNVPEPTTYALMGLGLVGIAFAARKKSA